jgi:regulator of sirC expression with transglutaminase-like and TPR domain
MPPLLELLTGRGQALTLDRAALELARIEFPNLDAQPSLTLLDSFAHELSRRLAGRTGGASYCETANQYLFGELGFLGNTTNYYDPGNSCLNQVLTSRTGIPITLAVVYLEVARRLAQPVYGIGLPGHFLVRYRSADFDAFIDVFDAGRLLTEAQCFERARRASAAAIAGDPRLLAPVDTRQIVMRMLRNLSNVYVKSRAFGKALQALNLLVAADPTDRAEIEKLQKLRGYLARLN